MMRKMSKIKHFANTWFNTLGNETKTIFGKVSMIFPIAIIRVWVRIKGKVIEVGIFYTLGLTKEAYFVVKL